MLELTFYEYRPVWAYHQTIDPAFDFDKYFGFFDFSKWIIDRIEDDTPRFCIDDDGQLYFIGVEEWPTYDYRNFTILINGWDRLLYIAHPLLEIGWIAKTSIFSSDEEIVVEAQSFIDSWYSQQLSAGQLSLF